MNVDSAILRLTATDLANHLACRHLTALDKDAAEGHRDPPKWQRPEADLLRERGDAHERAYLQHLEQSDHAVVRLDERAGDGAGLEQTLAAMRSGARVVSQATLSHGRWIGRADVLLRVERPSRLGAWSYEALDTKLARETKAGAILQLCLYSDLLTEIQGARPELMHIVPRTPGFERESHRVEDYLAYYRLVRRMLEGAVDDAHDIATYPEPVDHCEICRWWPHCDAQRRSDDHLSLVAGISRLQTRELQSRAIQTLARLAVEPLPIGWKPARGAREGYARAREQARVQLEGRTEGKAVCEMLPFAPGHGLGLLPEPSPGDLFLDLESDPYVDDGGLEYLFGWVAADPPPPGMLALDTGASVYHHRWATDRGSERRAFETLIDTIIERLELDPNMHVYHYGVYEPGAIKRLMGRYATREMEVDRLLRGGRFVDLLAVVKESLRASVENYSLKDMERIFGFVRVQPLDSAKSALRVLERTLEFGTTLDPEAEHAVIVRTYNQDDCMSTLALRDWLEDRRAAAIAGGIEIERPLFQPEDPPEAVREHERRALALAARLLHDIPDEERTDEQHAQWLLAHLLDWHRRETKSAIWEKFRLGRMSDGDLLDEMAAIAGLEFLQRVPSRGRTPVDRYRFPAQDTRIREGDKVLTTGLNPVNFGEVIAIDLVGCTVDIKKLEKRSNDHPTSVFEHETYWSDEQFESLMRLGEWVSVEGIDSPGPYRAARDVLLRHAPRIVGGLEGPLELPDEDGFRACRRIANLLDHTTLAIQGPPGSGKTFTGARMVCDLVRTGKRVGICAFSHKVIANFMEGVLNAAAEGGITVSSLRKVSGAVDAGAVVRETAKNEDVVNELRGGRIQLAGGTAWLWSRQDMFEAVDVLFVDEAGQMSLANVIAIAQGARSLVLLGDPQQLEQPVRGTHPEGTAVSALQHVLGEAPTIAPDRGLFLEETWRLAPSLCDLTSQLFYERRLRPHAGLERQELLGETPFAGAGLWYVPVDHDANQSSSPEEVEVVADLVSGLLREGLRWRDREGIEKALRPEDILVIAPYNAQVSDLGRRLPAGMRVGTVDRFQGQQAPVVIYSLTTSTHRDAPRGMDFLYDPNRFNVATSRAKCACIVVGSPRLFEPDCQSPKQMKLANVFCRFQELARTVTSEALAPTHP